MAWLLLAMLANAAYVAAMPAANVFYIGNVLLHLLLGTAGTVWLVWGARRNPRAIPLLIGGMLGAYLLFAGATSNHRGILWTHLALAAIGLALLKPRWGAGLAVLAVAATALRLGPPPDRIRNPQTVPLAMTGEGAGTRSPFWPSSARTNTGGLIPSDFFMDSQLCGECHRDIYEQWKSSMHHFASFNNQFYKASILHMQKLSGTQGSKWCAGCHDHAVFFNGRFERPIKEQLENVPALAPDRLQPQSVDPQTRRLPDLAEPGAPPAHVHESVHEGNRFGGILFGVPQGSPGRAGQPLSLVPGLQRVR